MTQHECIPMWFSWSESIAFQHIVYLKFVEIGELDDTQFYNVRTKKYHDSDTRNFDIGFKGKDTFRYSDGEWRGITRTC